MALYYLNPYAINIFYLQFFKKSRCYVSNSHVATIAFPVKELRILYCDLYSLPRFKKYWSLAIMWNLIVMDLFQPDSWNHLILSHLYNKGLWHGYHNHKLYLVRLQLYLSVLALQCNLESRYNCLFFNQVTYNLLCIDLRLTNRFWREHRNRSAHSWGPSPSILTSVAWVHRCALISGCLAGVLCLLSVMGLCPFYELKMFRTRWIVD